LNLGTPSTHDFFATTFGATGTLGGTMNVQFASGVGTATVYFGDTTAETQTLTAKNGTTTWGSASLLTAGAGTKLVITSAAINGVHGTSATYAVTITLEDASGNFTTSSSAIAIGLASTTPNTGVAKFAATSAGATAITSVSLPPTTQSVTVYYAYSKATSSPVITVSGSALTSGTQTETFS
jgi:hypothetical protein